MHYRKNKGIHLFGLILGVAAIVLIGLFSVYMLWERSPAVKPAATPEPSAAPTAPSLAPGEEPLEEGEAVLTERQDGLVTILLAGNDNGNGNTDTIMVARLDTENHRLDVVSLPRDTIINYDWDVRKLNTVYGGSLNTGGNGVDSLVYNVRRLIGFDVDCYAVVDLDVFVEAVDLMGGVTMDLPAAVDYEDWSQDIWLHLQPGVQTLDGRTAMGLCRYREGYITGDLGRIDMQHAFLKAAAEQFISLGKIPNAAKVVRMAAQRTVTDLTAANMAWLARQLLACDSDSVNFYTMPTTTEVLNGYSYAVPQLWPWLDMINARLNPYSQVISSEDLDMIYKEAYGYAATRDMAGEWYFETAETPEPEVTVIEDPAPTEAPPPESETQNETGG